ncbi:MAG: hypothetical protein AB8B55_04615 [Mariniblastus sp.]
MANFFLIDHSLRKAGGHHYDYARCVAEAANDFGFLTSVGANRQFGRQQSEQGSSLEQYGQVRRVFRDTVYQPDSYLAGLQHLTRSKSHELIQDDSEERRVTKYLAGFKKFKHRRRREKFVRQFATDCDRFFRPSLQTPGDHAFLTTVSELELMGLAVYLSSHSKTLQTHWHLQFHYNLFDGRTPEYESQNSVLQAVRSCFLAALARLSYHSVHFYTTSQTLVDQYNQLGVGEFQLLPYPVARDFATDEFSKMEFGESKLGEPASHRQPALLRGEFELSNLVEQSDLNPVTDFESDQIRSGQLASGQIELGGLDEDLAFAFSEKDDTPRDDNQVGSATTLSFMDYASQTAPGLNPNGQSQGDHFHKPLRLTCPGELRREKGQLDYLQPLVNEIWPTHLATGNVQVIVQRPARKWHSKKQKIELELPEAPAENCNPIEYFSHPLSHEDYVQLIKSTDCGLLFYDSRVYFSRRAGVLGELLSAGKPVIVSAGSWLAEQIQNPIFEHVDSLLRSNSIARELSLGDFNWNSKNVPNSGGVLSFDKAQHPFEFTVGREAGESSLVLRFDWHWPKTQGVYVRIDVSQMDERGEVIDQCSRVIGGSRTDLQPSSIFNMQSETYSVKFSLTNAFHNSMASVKRVEVLTLASDSGVEELPIGQVGIIASDQADLARCIDEVVKHYDHYSKSATRFSTRWYSSHQPKRTVGHLVSIGEAMMGRAG